MHVIVKGMFCLPSLLLGSRPLYRPWLPELRDCWREFHAEHCSSQWHTSSTSPLSHSLQTRSSLFNPCHLPISILNTVGIVVGFTMPIPPPHAALVEQAANVRCQCICTSFGCRLIGVALCNISSVLELSINKVRISRCQMLVNLH